MTCKSSSSTQQPPLKITSHPTTRISHIHQIYSMKKKKERKKEIKSETKQKFFHQKEKIERNNVFKRQCNSFHSKEQQRSHLTISISVSKFIKST